MLYCAPPLGIQLLFSATPIPLYSTAIALYRLWLQFSPNLFCRIETVIKVKGANWIDKARAAIKKPNGLTKYEDFIRIIFLGRANIWETMLFLSTSLSWRGFCCCAFCTASNDTECYKSTVRVGEFVLLLQLCWARSLPKTDVFCFFLPGVLFSILHIFNQIHLYFLPVQPNWLPLGEMACALCGAGPYFITLLCARTSCLQRAGYALVWWDVLSFLFTKWHNEFTVAFEFTSPTTQGNSSNIIFIWKFTLKAL